MRFGYMPGFETNLISEINFAKEGFDFIEITLKLSLKEYTDKYIETIKNALNNFEVLGHIHWEIDLSKGNEREIEKVFQMIEIYKKIGTKKITIHPSYGNGKNISKIKKNNLQSLLKINDFCRKNRIELLIENSATGPFSKASIMKELVVQIPNSAITLDIGHANRNSELDNFLELSSLIGHVHLHDNIQEKDHLPFTNRNKLYSCLENLEKLNYNDTITLEIFYSIKNSEYTPLGLTEKRKLLINQVKLVRDYFSKNIS